MQNKIINTASGNFNETNIAFTRMQSKLTALQQEVNYKQTQLKDLHAQIEQNKTQAEEVQSR